MHARRCAGRITFPGLQRRCTSGIEGDHGAKEWRRPGLVEESRDEGIARVYRLQRCAAAMRPADERNAIPGNLAPRREVVERAERVEPTIRRRDRSLPV